MGPWHHGGWNSGNGRMLGDADFGFDTAKIFRDKLQLPFFKKTLNGDERPDLSEAFVFETGANRWRSYDHWPPADAKKASLTFAAGGKLISADPVETASPPSMRSGVPVATADQTPWISDPEKPVPYTQEVTAGWAKDYMTEDQRFAARRPDVLVFRTETLDKDLTIAGPLRAQLSFSTTGKSADIIVKLVDEFPGEPVHRGPESPIPDQFQSGRQQLVRAGVMRGRFRNSMEKPEPFVPGRVTDVTIPLHDVHHTFKTGHRLMIQVQSTWFPFIDRNPQTWVENIFDAQGDDFQTQLHRLHHSPASTSRIEFLSL